MLKRFRVIQQQGLYLVIGGELRSLDKNEFKENSAIDIVGIYRDYDEAKSAWRGKAQSTVDNAHQRYYVVPLHEYLDSL